MITLKVKVVLLISLILILVLSAVIFKFPNKEITNKPNPKLDYAVRFNNTENSSGEVPRSPIFNTQDLIDIMGYTSVDKYIMEDPAYHDYLYFQILVHKADDNIMSYNNENLWESKYKASCYKYYSISPGEDELDDILSLNLREGNNLYSFIITPSQNREIIQKVIDDKLMDLPRLDNIDIISVKEQFDKEYKMITVSATSIHTLNEVSKPKIEAFIAWFEGKFYDELKKHPVDIFPSDVPARDPDAPKPAP